MDPEPKEYRSIDGEWITLSRAELSDYCDILSPAFNGVDMEIDTQFLLMNGVANRLADTNPASDPEARRRVAEVVTRMRAFIGGEMIDDVLDPMPPCGDFWTSAAEDDRSDDLTDDGSPQAAFINDVRSGFLDVGPLGSLSDEQVADLAHSACQIALDDGAMSAGFSLLSDDSTGATPEQIGEFVGGAVVRLCPDAIEG